MRGLAPAYYNAGIYDLVYETNCKRSSPGHCSAMHRHVSFPAQQVVSKFSTTMSDHYCLKGVYWYMLSSSFSFISSCSLPIHLLLGPVLSLHSICSGITFVQTPGFLLLLFFFLFLYRLHHVFQPQVAPYGSCRPFSLWSCHCC